LRRRAPSTATSCWGVAYTALGVMFAAESRGRHGGERYSQRQARRASHDQL
jgi:hypothetical protein